VKLIKALTIDDNHFTCSDLLFEIATPTLALNIKFEPQMGANNDMYIYSDKLEKLIEILQSYLKEIRRREKQKRSHTIDKSSKKE